MSKELIRAAGGHIYTNGHILFTSQAALDAYVAAISQPVQPAEPTGWRLVPVELTDKMLSQAWRDAVGQCDHQTLRHMYRNMIANAPESTHAQPVQPALARQGDAPEKATTVMKWLDANCVRVGWTIESATYEITDAQAFALANIFTIAQPVQPTKISDQPNINEEGLIDKNLVMPPDIRPMNIEIFTAANQFITKHIQTENVYDRPIDAMEEAFSAGAAWARHQPKPAQPTKGFQCEPQPAVTEDGFCEWVCPKPLGYLMQCCDCNLIHEVETRVAQYQPLPSVEFAVVDDPDLQVQWRMKRRDDLSVVQTALAFPHSADFSETTCPTCDSKFYVEREAAQPVQPASEPVAFARSDTVFGWNGKLINAAWMFPSPVGLKNPIALYAASVAQAEPLKDGEIAKIVNDLRDVALQFHGAQQLRERISQIVVPLLKSKGGAA